MPRACNHGDHQMDLLRISLNADPMRFDETWDADRAASTSLSELMAVRVDVVVIVNVGR